MTEEEIDYETKVINKIKIFYDSHKTLSKESFETFLNEVGLLDIWNTEDEKNYIYEVIFKYADKGTVSYDNTIKGIKEIFNPDDIEEPQQEEIPVEEKNKKHLHKRSVTKFFSQIDIDKIRQLRKVFSLLNLQDRGSVSVSQLQDILEKYKFIKIPLEELISFLNKICAEDNEDISHNGNQLLTIDFELYSKAISIMEKQMLQNNSDFFTENQNDSDSYEISHDPVEMIEDLSNMERETNDYLMVLSDIKMSLNECNSTTIENYNKIISGNNKSIEESCKENISHASFTFNNKLSDLEMFIKDMDNNSKKKQSKLDYFKTSIITLVENYKNIEDDYRKILANNHNEPISTVDEETVNKLVDENNAISKLLDERTNTIDKLQKEIKDKDDSYNKLMLEYTQCDEELKEKLKEIERLKIDNDQLRKNYNQMVNDVLEKIKQDDEDSKRLGIPLDEFKDRAQNEKDAIRAIQANMMLSERQKELCKMNYEKLLKYSFNLDLDNQHLKNTFNSLEEKIKKLEEQLEQNKKELTSQKQSYLTLKSQNTLLENKVSELQKDVDINMAFRPSKIQNQIRMSQLSNTNSITNQSIKIINTKEQKETFDNPFGADKEEGGPRLSKMDINGFQFGNIIRQNDSITHDGGMSRMDRDNLITESAFIVKGKNTMTPIEEESPFSPTHDKSNTFSSRPFDIQKQKTNSSMRSNSNIVDSEVRGSTVINQGENEGIEECINNAYIDFEGSSSKQNSQMNAESSFKIGSNNNTISNQMNIDISHLRGQTVDDIGKLLTNPSPNNGSNRINSYDFLTLRKNSVIQKLLDKEGDNSSSYEMFSDNVFTLQDNYKKQKRTIFITCEYVYILKSENFSVKQKFKRELLRKFTISNKNCNMIAFHFTKGDDLVIEILRRLELLYYFRDLYKFKNFGKLAFKYSDEFNIKKSGRYFTMKVYVSNDTVAQNFQNAEKLDYLYKMTEGFFSYSFNEKLVVLTNIGLLYFDDPTKPPKKLIAIVGSEINKCDEKKYGRKFCFEIRTLNKEHIVFAAKTEEDLNEWINAFKKMKTQYENKLSTIDEDKQKKK